MELLANLTSACEPPSKIARLTDGALMNSNSSPNAFDAPKRTRFTFRPEHLDVSNSSMRKTIEDHYLCVCVLLYLDSRESFS